MSRDVVAVHGLGGSPASLGMLPGALRDAGHRVVAPLLPGHGTTPDDLAASTRASWLDAVRAALPDGPAVLVGQSLGGVLALLVAASDPRVTGVAAFNAPVLPTDPDALEHLEWLLSRGTTMVPAGDADLADPDARDEAYDQLPVRALVELASLSTAAHEVLPGIEVPVLVVTSAHDGVVDPANGDELAGRVSGPVTRLLLPRSKHVACLDLDRDLLAARLLAWLDAL